MCNINAEGTEGGRRKKKKRKDEEDEKEEEEKHYRWNNIRHLSRRKAPIGSGCEDAAAPATPPAVEVPCASRRGCKISVGV